jgi:phosphoribosylformylglycinamidine synthase PurS subunit
VQVHGGGDAKPTKARRNEKPGATASTPAFTSKKSARVVSQLESTCGLAMGASPFQMKAKIIITPKRAVLDPQGKTVQTALAQMGYAGIGAVHVGKYLEIELTGADKEAARKQIDDACHKILSNPVIEEYRFEIE